MERLVSVGVPAYNRPEGLRQTLECLRAQTYRNLEIIISDNGSPGPEVGEVAAEFMKHDPRVSYFRQDRNRGPLANFDFVLERSAGEYFMWAADDDTWEPGFVKACAGHLDASDGDVAVMTEARYMSGGRKFEFFPEGRPFYGGSGCDALERMEHMLKHNYGNLFYSLFRKDAVLLEGRPFQSVMNLASLNEIPFLVFVAARGGFKVLPEVLMHKNAPEKVYRQARWEREGGALPDAGGWGHFRGLTGLYRYHRRVLGEVDKVLGVLKLEDADRARVLKQARRSLMGHFWSFVRRRK